MLRTCDAVGAAGLLLLGDDVDPFDPVTVRASMGAVFSQQLVRTTHEAIRRWAGRNGCLVAGTSPTAKVPYHRVDYRAPTVLLMGDERKGLSLRDLRLCDVVVRIPMLAHADSLNLAVATSLMLYEVFRFRRGCR